MLWWTIIIFLLILSLLVISHELGHFLVAKFFGVRVDEFGLGFPPTIKRLFTWRGTDFVLNLLPIGGYVNLAGENASPDEEERPDNDDPTLFCRQAAWKRFLVILAGPLVNIILAMFIFMIVYGVAGIPKEFADKVFIEGVQEKSSAEQAGLPVGAQVLFVQATDSAQIAITKNEQLMGFVADHVGQNIILTVQPDCEQGICHGEIATYEAYLRCSEERLFGEAALGVSLTQYQDMHYPLYKQIPLGIYHGVKRSFSMAWEMLENLGLYFRQLFHREPKTIDMMGPVGIVSSLNRYQTFSAGFLAILSLAGVLSLNLGIINLLPIPAVDGGRLVLIVAEKFVGRRTIAKIEAGLNYAGLVLILLLSLLITLKDVWRIFKGE